MELKYEGVTNSQRFVDRDNKVNINDAFIHYMDSQETMIENLKTCINMEDKEWALSYIKMKAEQYANMYYTLYEAYKNLKTI